MAPFRVDVTIRSAKDLKNVNWRHGDLRPYAVLWIEPEVKCSTGVAAVTDDGSTSPTWNETLKIQPRRQIEESTLHVDIVHHGAAEDTKPHVGSAAVPLKEILDEAAAGESCDRSVQLRRPSGRPQGKLKLQIHIRDLQRYYPHHPPPPPPPPPSYPSPYTPAYALPYDYVPPPPSPYPAVPPAGYPYNPPTYAGRQPDVAYGYGSEYGRTTETSRRKYGMGTGIAVGAVAGALGGLALAEGIDYVEDKIAADVADKVEDDLWYAADD